MTTERRIVPKNARLIPAGARKVFSGQIFDVYQWEQEMFDGSYQTFEMLKRPDTVNVLAVKGGRLVVLKQQQPNTDEFYGAPGGRHDEPGESTLAAAQRELLEETGMTFRNWKLVDVRQPYGKIEHFLYTFVASDFIKQQSPNLDVGEKIEVQLMDLGEVRRLIDEPNINTRGDFPPEIFDNIEQISDLERWPAYGAS